MVELTDHVLDRLESYTVKELQAIAKKLGLKSLAGKKKQVLIDRISEAAKAARSDNDAPGLPAENSEKETNIPSLFWASGKEVKQQTGRKSRKADRTEVKRLGKSSASGKNEEAESRSASFVKESRLGGKKNDANAPAARQKPARPASSPAPEKKPAENKKKTFGNSGPHRTLNKEEEAQLEAAIRETEARKRRNDTSGHAAAKTDSGQRNTRQKSSRPQNEPARQSRSTEKQAGEEKGAKAASPQKQQGQRQHKKHPSNQQQSGAQKQSQQHKNQQQHKQATKPKAPVKKQPDLLEEHENLPVSNASSLLERVEELRPKLGGLIINEGTLEILPDGYGFLRSVTYHLQSSPDDIYVSPSQIKRFALRQGDTVVGIIRPPKVGERYFALIRVEGVNGIVPNNVDARPDFEDLLPVYPEQRLKLETSPFQYATRLMDLFAPLGKGQRGLIVAQPKTGKTSILRMTANAVAANSPEAKIMILLVDERPEEVTEMRRNVANAEVMASTFDMKPENHIALAELVFEKAKRLVESGHDVVLLMDSLTRLARAYNIATNSGRTMSGGVDSEALKKPRKLFSLARNVENGGSLTILATALVNTGSRMDDVIFEEFKGTGNMELVLERRIAEQRVFPAIDVFKSGTRREELFVREDEREKVVLLRRFLSNMSPLESIEFLLSKIHGTRNNQEFLISMNQ